MCAAGVRCWCALLVWAGWRRMSSTRSKRCATAVHVLCMCCA